MKRRQFDYWREALLCAGIALVLLIVLLYPILSRADDAAPADETGTAAITCDGDGDCDGAPDDLEQRVGTDPQKCDTDEDGLSDGVELGLIQPKDVNGCHGLMPAGTNYKKPHSMDPKNPDSDGDGLKDGEEDRNFNGWVDPDETDPTIEDTDGDGITDYVETTFDFDEDRLPDFDFTTIKAGPKCSPPESMTDIDCDGIPNARDDDSDDDGCADKLEDGWVDTNSNGTPDLYDNQAKSCPDPVTSTPSGGAKPAAKKEGAADENAFFGNDDGQSGPCSITRGAPIHVGNLALSGLFIAMGIAIIACLRSESKSAPGPLSAWEKKTGAQGKGSGLNN